ncbi:MAG TPA: NfeD family protein, partial [Pirellulales bacterium]
AYLPKSISGHAVLLALACDEIVMAEDAAFGEAGKDEKTITDDLRSAYREIARRRRTVPEAVAARLLDPAAAVFKVQTLDGATQFVLRDELDALKAAGQPQELFPAGEPLVISAGEGREYGFVRLFASDAAALADAYRLPREALADDLMIDGDYKTARIEIRGSFGSGDRLQAAQKLIVDAIAAGKNFLVFQIDSPGGDPDQAAVLAGAIAGLDASKIRTVAFIQHEARGDAMLIALACDLIVAAPGAVLGGSPSGVKIDDEIAATSAVAAARIAQQKFRSPALARAMLDPSVEVFRYRHGATVRYLTAEEVEKLPDAAKWTRDGVVSRPGEVFETTGRQGYDEYGLVWEMSEDFNGLRALFGLEEDPALLESGWADQLLHWLRDPNVAFVVLAIGAMAFWAEMNVPAIGLGWLIGSICFLLFFWSKFLGGTAGWLEVLLFGAGMACMMLEIFVLPGFGLFGLAGGLLILVSLILASQTFVVPHSDAEFWQLTSTMSGLVLIFGAAIVGGVVLRVYFPQTSLFKRFMLEPPTSEELASADGPATTIDSGAESLVGRTGVAMTRLAPAGKAQIGDRYIDVLADGEYLERGEPIHVVQARGNRIIVKRLS